jgi:short-chain Z-isoprenyl diphosphate synthase
MAVTDPLYRVYTARLERGVVAAGVPCHVGVILDGNRRFALERGGDAAAGHAAGAEKIHEFLGWCADLGIAHVTLWMLSTDNLARDDVEISALLSIITETVDGLVTRPEARRRRQRVTAVGALDMLPDAVRERLKAAQEATREHDGVHVQVAVGYGGRQEICDAVRSLLHERTAAGATVDEIADALTPEQVEQHLYSAGVPDPELIIRTSGEVRLSGFLLWQSAHSEYVFADPYWPAFRRLDFLRALRDYQGRVRRYGR